MNTKGGLNLKEILASGTPRQKALLIIEHDEQSQHPGGGFLTEADLKAIGDSVKHNPADAKALKAYLTISMRYSDNRFRLYGLQENLKKLTARIAGFCYLWELSEQHAEFCNVLLGFLDADGKGVSKGAHKSDIKKYIYQSCRSWNKYVSIVRQKDKDGTDKRDVEVDLSGLREVLDGVIADYTWSMQMAKGFSIASDEFIGKYRASAFVPEDIKEMFEYFKAPRTEIPELYRRDTYLQLLKMKGEDDREVQYRKKYAILPSWEEITPLNLEDAKEVFSL